MGQLRLENERLLEPELSDEALALIDHIGRILAEEYVRLLKFDPQTKDPQEES